MEIKVKRPKSPMKAKEMKANNPVALMVDLMIINREEKQELPRDETSGRKEQTQLQTLVVAHLQKMKDLNLKKITLI
jgi:hypothetical protein